MESFLPLILLAIFLLYEESRRRKNAFIQKRAVRKRQNKGDITMNELVRNYVGKHCVISTMGSGFDGNYMGFIREIQENWLLVESKKGTDIINLDYVVRIQELPLKKKGSALNL